MAGSTRPSIKIRFRYNVDSGEIEQLIVDDQAPDRSEKYHDQVAGAIAGYLGRRPRIKDAGPRHLLREAVREEAVEAPARPEEEIDEETQAE